MLEKLQMLFLVPGTVLTLLGLIIENEPCRYIGLTCLIVCNIISLYRLSHKKKEE